MKARLRENRASIDMQVTEATKLRSWLRSGMAERRADLAVRGDDTLNHAVPWSATSHATLMQEAILRGDPPQKLQLLIDQYGGEWMRLSCNARGMNAIHCAASTGHMPTIVWLVETKHMPVSDDIRDNEGATALHYAARGGHIEMLQYLVEAQGLDVTAVTNDEQGILHWACQGGQFEAVKYLHKNYARRGKVAGVDLRATDAFGSNLLQYACGSDNHELVEWLKEHDIGVKADEEAKKQKKKKRDLKAIYSVLRPPPELLGNDDGEGDDDAFDM